MEKISRRVWVRVARERGRRTTVERAKIMLRDWNALQGKRSYVIREVLFRV